MFEKENDEGTSLFQHRVDALCDEINKMIKNLPIDNSSNTCFFSVSNYWSDVRAFGCRPEEMYRNKLVYLKQLVQRGHHNGKDILRECATSYYKDPELLKEHLHKDIIDFYSGGLIVDICFIIEFIYKCTNADLIEENDPIFLRGRNLQNVVQSMFDLSLQIPFVFLKNIFHITEEEENGFIDVVARFMEQELCLGPIHVDRRHHLEKTKHLHLLDFVHDIWIKSSEIGRAMLVKVGRRTGRQRIIRNATELQRAGVGFKGVNRATFDLKFRRGLLEIPVLSITTETESFLRNIIALEESLQGDKMLVVTDYCVLMDCLIQSPEDVRLLREFGAIESYLHDDKDVVLLFERLGKRVPSSTHFCYSDLFDQLNQHCVRRWNSWVANLRRKYFREDNQLETVSFVFAIYIILPVTILQTVYTVLSYFKG